MIFSQRVLNYLGFAFFAAVLVGVFYFRRLRAQMHTRARYTVGYLDNSFRTTGPGRSYNFHYQVQGNLYQHADAGEPEMNKMPGSRFLVEYDSLAPGTSTGHFAITIPDSIAASPKNGWQLPPFAIPTGRLPATSDSL